MHYSMDDVIHVEISEPPFWYFRQDLRDDFNVSNNTEVETILKDAGVIHSRNRPDSTDTHLYLTFSTEPSAENFLTRLTQYLHARNLILRVEYDLEPTLVANILHKEHEDNGLDIMSLTKRSLKRFVRERLSEHGSKYYPHHKTQQIKQITHDVVIPTLFC